MRPAQALVSLQEALNQVWLVELFYGINASQITKVTALLRHDLWDLAGGIVRLLVGERKERGGSRTSAGPWSAGSPRWCAATDSTQPGQALRSVGGTAATTPRMSNSGA